MRHRLAVWSLAVLPIATISVATAAKAASGSIAQPAPALQSDEFTRERAALRSALVERLLKLASWCHDQQIFLERDVVWRRVIEIDPDNAEARKGLRFARNPDGSWKEPPARAAQNFNKKALEELPAKRAAAVEPYRDAILELVAKEPTPELVAREVHAEILLLDPDDARIHEILGDVKDGDRWVLQETARGKQRRSEIKSIVKTAMDTPAAIEPTSASASEATWADAWSCSASIGTLRVLGCGGTSDCESLAKSLAGTSTALAGMLNTELKQPDGFNFYVVSGSSARSAFLERCSMLDDAARKLLVQAPGGGLPGSHSTVLFEPDAKRRVDCAVRNAISHVLWTNFSIQERHGWAWEGLGIYLTRELVGTRYTWYSLAGPNAAALKSSLLAPESNWMNEGLKLLAGGSTDLGSVLAKPVSAYGLEDMLVSYVFGAYLVEGQPAKAAEFLRGTGKDQKPEDCSRAVFGWSMPTLHDHVVRWLQERR